MKQFLSFFDLNLRGRSTSPRDPTQEDEEGLYLGKPRHLSFGTQTLLYVGILLGVIFSSAVQQFRTGDSISLSLRTGSIVASALISFMILPIVYEKLRLRTDAPILVQFGLCVQHGVFWQVLITGLSKVVR